MAYADFDLRRAVHTFGLVEDRDTDLFAAIAPIPPSEFLRAWLDELAPIALGVNSAKARSALIIAPTLIEAKRQAVVAIRLFNEREGTPLPAVFGCVTSGSLWRFLKLEGSTLFLDRPEYRLRDIDRILGIVVSIARG